MIRNSIRTYMLAAVIAVAPATMVKAAGFPVVDISAIAQAALDYSNQLLHYTELMEQTVLNESQLVEALRAYEQTMIEYDHMLRQMEGLKSRIENRQWQQIYAKYGDLINTYPGMKPDFDTGRWMKTNRELEALYRRAKNLQSTEDAIALMGFDADSMNRMTKSAQQSYAREQLSVGQQMFVEDMDAELELQMERHGEVAEKRQALGPEDHLATMQVMTEQNELLIEALHQQNAINNAQLQYSNQLESHYFSKNNNARDATLNEVKARQSRRINIDNSSITNF